MRTNQAGELVQEDLLYAWGMLHSPLTEKERDQALALICEHLRVMIVRTNATKHGTTELVLRTSEP